MLDKFAGFLVLFLFLNLQDAGAQQQLTSNDKKAVEAYQNGMKSYSQKRYSIAENQFLSAIDADNRFIEAYLILAELYEEWEKPKEAIATYKKGLPFNETFYPYAYVRLGNIECNEGLYADALVDFNHFLVLEKNNLYQINTAKKGIANCEFSIHAMNNPVDFKPVSVGIGVNTAADEYWPTVSADEKTLIVTRLIPSNDPGKTVQEDFFISHWHDSVWGPLENAGGPLNTPDNEGAQTITGDGRYMVFTACNRRGGLGKCDLYASEKQGDTWSVPVNLGLPVNTKYRETQPSISADGRTLYFSSNRPGGIGNHDIWVTYRLQDGTWSVPENLGDSINTPGVEMSPFIHPDNRSLYFSSDGLTGLGGHDLFVSRKDTAGRWQKPVNLGYPINTNGDEIGLVLNSAGDKAYYSTDVNKTNGKDIYVFDMPVHLRPLMVTYMKGKVFDAKNKRLLKAQLELVDLESGKVIFSSFSDSVTGEFLVSIPVNRNYLLNVSKKSYLFYSENFSLKNTFRADKPYIKDVPLQPIVTGNTIVLRNVFFETDSYALKKESTIELSKVVKLLQANPRIKIEIGGHTDNTGGADHNLKLSQNRARSVADYLISSSVDPARIVIKGYGFTKPMASNDTEEGKAQNRRTEMKIIEQ